MRLETILSDKTRKPREKTEYLSGLLLDNTISTDALCAFARAAKDPVKATCIEALEYATRQNQKIANATMFRLVTEELSSKAPHVKWESAKVIGNTAGLFPHLLEEAIHKLLDNTTYDGTVVRWSTAYALGEILKLKTKHYTNLLATLKTIYEQEEKSSIKKLYLSAIKKCE